MHQFNINANQIIFSRRISQSGTTTAHQFKILPNDQQNVVDKVADQ